jgi:ABC-2 type transport system permease protein
MTVHINAIKHHIGLYARLIRAVIRGQAQSRTSFILDMLSTLLMTVVEFSALLLLFGRFQQLGGWSVAQVAVLYGFAELSFGVMGMVFAGFDPSNFSQYIRNGSLDQVLLRPAPVVLQVFGSDFTTRRLGRVVSGGLILSLALANVPITWDAQKIAYIPVVLLSLIFYFGGLFILGATLCFWTTDSSEATNILTYGGAYLISHPMHIYSEWLRWLFTYLIPAIFLTYYPTLWLLGLPDPFAMPEWVVGLAPVVGLAVFMLALLAFRFGLKHYQGTGN